MATFFYYLGLSALSAHEMDAVRHAEWRLLYVLRSLPDDLAYTLFVALHVPLFYLLFWLSHHDNGTVQRTFRLAVAAFMVIHAILHFHLSGDADYSFAGLFSNGLIYVSAACGLGCLILAVRTRAPGGR